MNLDDAATNFRRALEHCDNLIAVHRASGGPSQGRRAKETSINRAVIVIAVATWQALVEDLAAACVDLSAPSTGAVISHQTYQFLKGRMSADVDRFSTPNARNSRNLLLGAGFDAEPCWTWSQHAGQGQGVKKWMPQDAAKRIDEWLAVRHAIAHGHDHLPQVDALIAVRRVPNQPPANPSLRLVDAEQCLVFFRRIGQLTANGLAKHLGVSAPRLS